MSLEITISAYVIFRCHVGDRNFPRHSVEGHKLIVGQVVIIPQDLPIVIIIVLEIGQ
jgi:hypothetical protein